MYLATLRRQVRGFDPNLLDFHLHRCYNHHEPVGR